MTKVIVILFTVSVVFILIVLNFPNISINSDDVRNVISSNIPTAIINPTPTPLPTPPKSKTLNNDYHIFQTFNNCGPAALSMALSYFDINVSQKILGDELRPYQIANGDNDDKSTTLEEMAEKSKDYNLIPYHRPNGDIDKIKLFIANDIPVVTRTWLKPNEDIGHYRIVKGYNDTTQTLIQDDSLQGKNLLYSYYEFNTIWKKFNYEYLVLVPKEKEDIAKAILKDEVDYKKSWKKAADNAKKVLAEEPNDIYARFNLSVALYNVGDYKGSVEEFEKVQNTLSPRTLWYQIEPIEAYYHLGHYDKVFEITDRILQNHNRAFSELYILRGEIYLKQNNIGAARSELEKAVLYNRNSQEAQKSLQKVS